LLQLDKLTALTIYASAGIWYDAFAVVSELIKISPDDVELIKSRNALLAQIGLSEIIQHE
jgi:methyl coenzyme M reductase subunit C